MIVSVIERTLTGLDALSQIREPQRTVLREAAGDWIANLDQSLVSLVLFGSVARGDARGDSDIDMLIVANDLPHGARDRRALFLDRWRALRDQNPLPSAEWNLIVKSPEEAEYHSPLYLDMTEEALFLFDRDGFFKRVLLRMKERMEALGSRRKFLSDGSWYWDLKPDYRFGEDVEI